MKFALLVEGETEGLGLAAFMNRWLADQFEPRTSPGFKVSEYEGWSALRDDAPKKAKTYLTEHAHRDVIAVISLLDLYGPDIYPTHKTTVAERYAAGRKYMEDRVKKYFKDEGLPSDLSTKYRHFFAVHETEAWFLTRPDLFHKDIRNALSKQKPPEDVNFKTPPGKLLEDLHLRFTRHAYVKTSTAKNIFPKLDAQATADKCPYLSNMLLELREMARVAGAKPRGDWADG